MPPPVYGAVTTTDKASEYRIYFSKSLLDHQIDTLQLYNLAYQVEIPTGQGSKTIRMFRPPVANVANVITLSEGQPPSNAHYTLTSENHPSPRDSANADVIALTDTSYESSVMV